MSQSVLGDRPAVRDAVKRGRSGRRILFAVVAIVITAVGAWALMRPSRSAPAVGGAKPTVEGELAAASEATSNVVRLPRTAWGAAGLRVSPAKAGPLAEAVRVTGRVALNEDRIAHIFPLVEGRVEEVKVRFGERVKAGEVLAVIQSKEVGQRKLELVQSRLAFEHAEMVRDRAAEVDRNTQDLIKALEGKASVEEIDRSFRGKPIGDYRDRLVTAYAALSKASADYARVEELTGKGITSEKDLTAARAARDAARATFAARLEEIKFDARQQAHAAGHELREANARVAAAEATLAILGYTAEELETIDPAAEGEALSHYVVAAPFDGTILTKDVALLESVGADRQLFQIADLSTVWVVADVYERHLPLLEGLDGESIGVRSEAVPGLTAEARVFSTGPTVDEQTRTARLRAAAENADGRLKPGMFVEVELPGAAGGSVLQVPESAVLEHAGKRFVFVKTGEETFARRDVTLGRAAGDVVEVVEGLKAGEPVVVSGGFALKSKLLAELMGEE